MNQHVEVKKFSHVKPSDTKFKEGGLRDFFLYRDLGIADATGGQVICHLVKANPDLPPETGTGWHQHLCEFQIVIMTKGWAKFMYEDKVTLVEAGDVVHQRPGITHYLFDYSKDMEYLEIVVIDERFLGEPIDKWHQVHDQNHLGDKERSNGCRHER